MQIIFCDIFAWVSDVKNLDIFQNIFLEHIFFFHNHPFQTFPVSKTYIRIYRCKKNLHNIERPLTAWGGGCQVNALSDATVKNASFFLRAPFNINNLYCIH